MLLLLFACVDATSGGLRKGQAEPGAIDGGGDGAAGGEGDGGPSDGGVADSATTDSAASDSGSAEGGAGSGGGAGDGGASEGGDGVEPVAPLRVAVISDLNGSYGSTSYSSNVESAIDALLADPPDLVLSTGDMVAGQRGGLDYEAMWASFHAEVSDRLAGAGIPFAVTPGNHDASGYAGYEEEREAYAAAWADRWPEVEWVEAEDYPFRYAFRAGGALFVSLDDTLVGEMDSEQKAWLSGVLDSADEVKIVFGHVPLYPVAEGRESEALFDAELEELLLERGVDAFISGHHHAWYPGRRGDLRLVAMACLGDGPRELIGTSEDSPRSLARFEVAEGGLVGLEAYGGAAFDTRLDRADLPAAVGSGGDAVQRDDL